MDYTFKNSTDIKAILNKYDFAVEFYFVYKIGYDGKIYILADSEGSSEGFRKYSTIILEVDWDEETVVGDSCIYLGELKSDYYHIQPIGNNILLVGSRCRYNNGEPEKNAIIISRDGNIVDRFCLGDGIQSVFVRPDNTIATSYFDEGVFGNFGWDDPIGSVGLIIWNSKGEQLSHADHDICDCYAMNIDEAGDIWYYYYYDFKLVCLANGKERDWEPHISGSHFIIITEDRQSVIFDSGYDNHGCYEKFELNHENDQNEKVKLMYEGEDLLVKRHTSYSSKAFFIDNKSRLFVKRFIS